MKENITCELESSLSEFGQRIKIARIRRDLSAEQVARQAQICRSTVIKIEKGYSGVAIGYYVRVLAVLGLDGNLISVVLNDPIGRTLFESKFHKGSTALPNNRRQNKSAEIKRKMYDRMSH